jgi:two-component system, chemotaxis family, CheB/CheR fusion protein
MNALGTRLVGVRVLVVDDDDDLRYVTCASLESQGAIVTESASAREAFHVLRQERPDVLVSDLSMPPGEDGYWLIAAVRALSIAHGGGTPAAALTGHVTAEDRARVLRAGFQFHIAKPAEPERLVGIVAILALTR